MHVDRRLGPGAHVEVLARCGIHRAGALLRDRLSPGLKLAPAGELILGRRRDPGSQRLRQATVAGEHAGQRLQQRVQRIQRDAAVHPGVEVALARANRDVEVAETAHREVELRRAASLHPAVEDDPRVGAALVGGEPVDDRVTTDLLLAVAGEAQVDGKLTRLGEQLRCLEEHPELALVVRHAPSVEPFAAHRGLERRCLPELERRRRLNVEVAVAEHRRRALGIFRGAELPDRERPLPGRRRPVDELGVAARAHAAW